MKPVRARVVLVIDDDAYVRDFLHAALASFGYAARLATGGEAGIRQFLAERPDFVLCDLLMPDKGGLEVIPELRHLDKDVPIAAISGCGDAHGADLLPVAKMLGASATLRKPFSVRELAACLEWLAAATR